MICKHCGKEFSDEFAYCPYCAEPKPEPEKSLEEEYVERVDKETGGMKKRAIIGGILFAVLGTLLLGPLGLVIAVVEVICLFIYAEAKRKKAKKPGRQFIINAQFSNDQTSICPKCGSHNVKVYRKGYDYGTGYWFRKHGGAYIAGMDANTACCHCMNCGNDWETDYDYRYVNK